MERIQAAIAKARQERQLNPASQTGERKRSRLAPKARPDHLWNDLPELVPKPQLLERNRVLTHQNAKGAATFDIVRTRTLRALQERGWSRMAITSPTPSCGKSTISVNLALSIARQRDMRAILIETDMRRPAIGKLLGLSSKRSVSDLLTGAAEFADCAGRIGENLALVTQNRPASDASDILLAQKMESILSDVQSTYMPDVMIFDTPPLLVNDDTLAFLAHLDCTLLVAAAGKSLIKEVDRCERELSSQTNVLGIVLNKCRFSSKEYYGGYQYDS